MKKGEGRNDSMIALPFFLITFYIIFNNYLDINQIVIDKNDIIIIIYLYNNINILYNLYF